MVVDVVGDYDGQYGIEGYSGQECVGGDGSSRERNRFASASGFSKYVSAFFFFGSSGAYGGLVN